MLVSYIFDFKFHKHIINPRVFADVLMGLRQPSWLPDIFTTYAESLRRTIRPSGRQSPSLQLGRQYDAMIVRSGSGGSCRLAHVYKYESPFAEVDKRWHARVVVQAQCKKQSFATLFASGT